MIELKNVSKYFEVNKEKQYVLRNVNLKIEKGDFITIMGPSGGGKSTLLNIIGLLTEKSSGEISFKGSEINYKKEKKTEKIRRDNIGFVFQNNNLINSLHVRENIMIAMNNDKNYKEKKEEARKLLETVGLRDKEKAKIGHLSGGQAQRISLVRALVNNPDILLCDEPTGALDSKNGNKVIDLLLDFRKKRNIALVIVTHDKTIGQLGDRQFYLEDGELNEIR